MRTKIMPAAIFIAAIFSAPPSWASPPVNYHRDGCVIDGELLLLDKNGLGAPLELPQGVSLAGMEGMMVDLAGDFIPPNYFSPRGGVIRAVGPCPFDNSGRPVPDTRKQPPAPQPVPSSSPQH